MTTGFDHGFVFATTIARIAEVLGQPFIQIIVCTDSKSFYDCLVKLGSTTEKRLIIDVMSLRESYEAREITEVCWIDGRDNPADAMTKKDPNDALTKLISTNKATVRSEGYVERRTTGQPH
ncbi:hypothetical protein MCOR20_011698 [Pyricularia oryzae]|nr:hypothetical protein MCOR20_011698 [Pyricularia oryzae]